MSVWDDDYCPYGTYEGERGNPRQWSSTFHYKFTKNSAKEFIKNESPYSILGVSPTASASEIKKAYRKLMLKHHPDKGGDIEKAKKIIAAYTLLMG